MQFNQVEGMLYSYPFLKAEIKNLKLEIEYIKSNYGNIGAIDTTEESTSETYDISSVVEDEIAEKEKQIKELQSVMNKKQLQVDRIDNILEALRPEDQKLIEMRYFKRLPNVQVANMLYITPSGVLYRRNCIINTLIDILNKTE